jgi:hypothetical protein
LSLTHNTCEAATFGHLKACGRCSLVWPADAADKRMCLDQASPVISLTAMGELVARAAEDLQSRQARLVRTGDRTTPYMPALNDAAVFRAIDRLLADILGDQQLRDRLKAIRKAAAQ